MAASRRRALERGYNTSMRGTARDFRARYGMTEMDSIHWAGVVLDPETRCAICGLPNFMLQTYHQRGPWLPWMGDRSRNRRLQLDHVEPGIHNGNYRPLCPACNSRRGAALFTDDEVLRWVTQRWTSVLSLRFLFWLNTSPGQGGRLHRSDWTARRDARFAEARAS